MCPTPPTVLCQIFETLQMFLSSGLKICMCFGYNPQIIFVPRLFEEKRRDIVFGFPSFCPSFRLSVPLKYYVPCVRNSSYSFMLILSKLYRCFCHGLKICMWFGYYPEIVFCPFFRYLNLVIFQAFLVPRLFEEKRRDIVLMALSYCILIFAYP